jgi:hypothetical protein
MTTKILTAPEIVLETLAISGKPQMTKQFLDLGFGDSGRW